ncbi:cupredoxin domain-containing protein [Haladaptatus cibarius]|uniref:cupredoxin domain-containing protein n=1 Tax=Haladaptatus cibarius TaxID=453847 RepID=UPI000679BEAB|nr:hypothetical protein [Haladaptatus cibarius]
MTGSPKSQRRAFLKTAGGVAGVGILGRIAMAQNNQTETTDTTNGGTNTTETTETTDGGTETTTGDERVIVLGGRTEAWLGLAPGVIERADNPTIGLVPGDRYRIVWVNLDGARHQLQILGEENGESGNVLRETETTSRRGATRSISFRATDRVRRYRCRYHPDSMRGNVVRSGDFGTGTEGTFTTEETTQTTADDFTDTTDGTFTTETTNGDFTDTTDGTFTTETTDDFTDTTERTYTTDTTNN